jgi:energy-coupling factor transport system substrate-specific component
MNALRASWSDTRMVVLTALSAALYAAVLIPFKILPIIPGVTEIRPANAIPMVTSLLFGPAGAWGSAFGNLIGDFFLGLGPGSAFGFLGNFLYGFVPYALWRALFGAAAPDSTRPLHWTALMGIFLVAGSACAFSIAWCIDVVLRGVPYAVLGSIILFNNVVMSVLLAPPLLFALLPRVARWGLLYTQILPEAATRRPRTAWLGAILISVGSVGGFGAGMAVATGLQGQRMGVPEVVRAFQRIVAPSAPAPSAPAPDEPSGRSPSGAGAPSASATTPAAAAPVGLGAQRMELALGLLPAWALIFLGVLLL